MSPLVAALAGFLLVAGVLGVVLGARSTWREVKPLKGRSSLGDAWVRLTHRPPGKKGKRRDIILAISVLAGFVAAALTGWLIAIALVPAVVLGLPVLLSMPTSRDVELLEALDRWVRNLSATLSTGRSITDAIRLSRRAAPEAIAEELTVLVARLNNRWDTRDALMRFADALDSPDADGVIAALILASNRGSNGAALTLNELADSIQAQLKGRRLIETERAKPYIVVRQVTVITIATFGITLIVGRGYFEPYSSPIGQLILTTLISLYVLSLIVMRRRARTRPRDRILIGAHR